MNTDRSIRLDISTPDLGARSGEQFSPGSGGMRGQPDADAQKRFEQRLSNLAPSGHEAAGSSALTPSPFSLFGVRATQAQASTSSVLSDQLQQMLAQLMVDDQTAGGKQVRMELKDGSLPGVTVIIHEAQGRLQVDFVCSVEDSRLRLTALAPDHASRLAARLARDVLLRVQSNDEDDPRLLEVAATP